MTRLRRLMAILASLGLALGAVLVASGCNTVQGLGEDITAVGEATTDAADGDD